MKSAKNIFRNEDFQTEESKMAGIVSISDNSNKDFYLIPNMGHTDFLFLTKHNNKTNGSSERKYEWSTALAVAHSSISHPANP